HICENIEGVLKIDGEVGNKKTYDPRGYLKKGEQSLCDRLKVACDDLLSTGKSIYGKV
ncbi:MAG: class II fructose-bisphosphate aldolase, partial [Akkermansiaceae bacterium]